MLSVVPARSGRGGHLGELVAAVRPEFCGKVIAVSPEDPVSGRGRCGPAGCGRSAWARDLCSAHHQRWANHGKPDLGEFKAGAAAAAVRAGSENADGFDLSALAVGARLEVAYVLQCRHDDRAVGVPPSTVRHLVGLLANSGAGSLTTIAKSTTTPTGSSPRSKTLQTPPRDRRLRRRRPTTLRPDPPTRHRSATAPPRHRATDHVRTRRPHSRRVSVLALPPARSANRQRHVSHMKPKLRTTTASSPPDNHQQPAPSPAPNRPRLLTPPTSKPAASS